MTTNPKVPPPRLVVGIDLGTTNSLAAIRAGKGARVLRDHDGEPLIPSVVLAIWGISQFPFGGTSILITVGVALETMKQLESQLLMRHYEGFLK